MKIKYLVITSVFLSLSFLTALFGLGHAYYKNITPKNSYGFFQKIGGDRWVEDGAMIALPELATRGNIMRLHFGPWHPPGAPPVRMQAYLCGTLISEFIAKPGVIQDLFLTSDCEPREVSFHVPEPLHALGSDNRRLGAQLAHVEVTSKLGIPILAPRMILTVALCIFFLACLVYVSLQHEALAVVIAILIISASFILLSRLSSFELWKLLWVYLFAMFTSFGMSITFFFKREKSLLVSSGWLSFCTIGVIVFLGGYLRFYNLDFGLPFRFHPDEVPKYNAVLRMLQHGDLNPRYFLHPSMLLYGTYFFSFLMRFGEVSDVFHELIYSGRVMSMTAGSLSLILVYGIASRLFSRGVGMLSAVFMSVVPLHVVCSRYVKEDVLLLFFILLCTYLVVLAADKNSRKIFFFAVLAGGLAASVKYSGLLCVCILVSVPWLHSKDIRPTPAWLLPTALLLCFFPLGFVIGTPYSVLDMQTFVRDFSQEKAHMIKGHSIVIDAWSQYWMYHFSRSLVPGVTFPLAAAALVGFGMFARRFCIKGLFIIACFLLFYLPAEYVNAKPAPQPERYIVPCIPFLMIGAAYFVHTLWRDKRFRSSGFLLAILLLLLPFFRTTEINRSIKNDTRIQMAAWIRSHIPKGSTLFIDWKPYSPQGLEEEYDVQYLPRSRIIPSFNIDELEKRRGYLLMSSLYYDRYFLQPEVNPMFREVVRNVFRSFPVLFHVTSKAGTYGFHNPRLSILDLTRRAEQTERNSDVLSELPSYVAELQVYQ